MRRRKYADGELDQLQRVRNENKKLKHQISQLRKQLARIDIDRFQNLKDLIDSQDRREQEEAAKEREIQVKKQWECWDCRQDYLKLVILERRDGVFYYRHCENCKKRTKLQKYTDKVNGEK